MQEFEYLEDYIEYLSGYLTKTGVRSSFSYASSSPIKLATYDKSPIASMGQAANKAFNNKEEVCLTDKQVSFARNLIGKYRRQLSSQGIELPLDMNCVPLRHKIRIIDRTFAIKLDEESKKMILKFPYNPSKIEKLHSARASTCCGHIAWDNEQKQWELAYTEGNIDLLLKIFDDNNNLEVLPPLDKVFQKFYDPTLVDSLPTLKYKDEKFEWINCHESILNYVYNAGKKLSPAMSASMAALMFVEVDSSVKEYLETLYPKLVVDWICNYKIVVPSNNQPQGEWLHNLHLLNTALCDVNWIFKLDWWSDKTDWSQFKNSTFLPRSNVPRSHNTIEFDNLECKNHIALFDTVVAGSQSEVNTYIAQTALKVIYISDIGAPGLA